MSTNQFTEDSYEQTLIDLFQRMGYQYECGPCKADLKDHARLLHQALNDLPVTYLYLCNGSATEAWRSTIAE